MTSQAVSLLTETSPPPPRFRRGLWAQDKNPSYADANLQPSGSVAYLHEHTHVSCPHREEKSSPRNGQRPSHPGFGHTKGRGATALPPIWPSGQGTGLYVEENR